MTLSTHCTSLDALSEVIAIFVAGEIPTLLVGRAQFSAIETWLAQPLRPLGTIATPQEALLSDIYNALEPIVLSPAPEAEWLGLLRLLRNKSAHLGNPLFRKIVLRGKDNQRYTFFPREWPFLWEKHMSVSRAEPARSAEALPDFLNAALIHQDIRSYSIAARRKILNLIGAGLNPVARAYTDFSSFPSNRLALEQLRKQSKTFQFTSFLEPTAESRDGTGVPRS